MTTSTEKHDTWDDWFHARESNSAINKARQEELFTVFNATLSAEECKNQMKDNDSIIFIAKLSLRSGVNIFHHLLETGSLIFNEPKAHAFIEGISQPISSLMTPDTEVLFEKPAGVAVPVPTPTSILAITSVEDVDGLADGATTTYKPRNFIPIPPFLMHSINSTIATSRGDAKTILVEVVNAIKEFDFVNAPDIDYVDSAKAKCKPLLFWLYLAGKDDIAIKPIPSENCTNPGLAAAYTQLKSQHLKVSSDNGTPASSAHLEALASSALTSQSMLLQMTSNQAKTTERTSRSFKKIPTKYQNMLLVASSTGEARPNVLNDTAMEFFSQSNSFNAQIMLNSLMEDARLQVSVSPAVATLLFNGSFLWTNTMTPSGFSGAVLSSENDVLRSDTFEEALVLNLSTKFEMSAASLTKLTKTQVVLPRSVDDTIERFKALKILAVLFFSDGSPIPLGLMHLVDWCEMNKITLSKYFYMDELFLARIIVAVEDRIFQWLRQCCKATSMMDTSLVLIDLKTLTDDLDLGRFTYNLPPSVQVLSKKNKDDKPHAVGSSAKKAKAAQAQMEKNDKVDSKNETRMTEQWNKVFGNKSKDGPVLSFGSKACVKYHSKGICYDDCFYKASHKSLGANDLKLYSDYVKKLRGE